MFSAHVRSRVRPLAIASVQLDVLQLDQAGHGSGFVLDRGGHLRARAVHGSELASANALTTAGCRLIISIASCRLSRIASGVPAGAHRPTQVNTSRPG